MKRVWENITYFFRRKYEQVRNIIRWIPILWKQYDFDYMYSVDVFKFQLENLHKRLSNEAAVTESSDRVARKLRTAIDLMDKVYKDEYSFEYYDHLETLFGKGVNDVEFIPVEGKPEVSRLVYKYELDKNPKDALRIQKVKDELFKRSQEKQERAHKLLWVYIEHHIRTWWD